MSQDELQILFLGELLVWLKVAQTAASAPAKTMRLLRAASLRDAMRCLAENKWDAVLLDVDFPAAKQLLSALKLHSVFHSVPAVAVLSRPDSRLEDAAIFAGAAGCLATERISETAIREAVLAAIKSKRPDEPTGQDTETQFLLDGREANVFPAGKIEALAHALNNLLCVITANADMLADKINGSAPGARSVEQIKKAAKSAAELMRNLETT